ncbi:MAG: hypothetical protein V7K48_13315 [Nostoc sp.]
MKLLPLDKLKAREANGTVDFGIFLPWISQDDRNRLKGCLKSPFVGSKTF